MAKTDQIARYRSRSLLLRLAAVLDMPVADLQRACDLPRDIGTDAKASVTAAQYFRIWEAADRFAPGGLTIEQSRAASRGLFSAQTFAFSCSPDVEAGLTRLALLKPLSGPYQIKLSRSDRLDIRLSAADPRVELPPRLHAIELAHLLHLIRTCGHRDIVPMSISMPYPDDSRAKTLESFAGVPVRAGPLSLSLSLDDAARPLAPANAEHWAAFDPALVSQIARAKASPSMAHQLRAALFETLPSGRASADALATHMGTSKRSLQRRLQAEGASFGETLEATRRELAMHYLAMEDLRVEEVSYLLAFRDPNSFYRAFQAWTGMTPRHARLAQRREKTGPTDPQN